MHGSQDVVVAEPGIRVSSSGLPEISCPNNLSDVIAAAKLPQALLGSGVTVCWVPSIEDLGQTHKLP